MWHKDQCPIKCGQKNSTGMSIRCVLRKLRIFEIKCRLPTGSGERLHRICAATTTSGKFVRVIFILLSLHNQLCNRNRLEWFKSPTTKAPYLFRVVTFTWFGNEFLTIIAEIFSPSYLWKMRFLLIFNHRMKIRTWGLHIPSETFWAHEDRIIGEKPTLTWNLVSSNDLRQIEKVSSCSSFGGG